MATKKTAKKKITNSMDKEANATSSRQRVLQQEALKKAAAVPKPKKTPVQAGVRAQPRAGVKVGHAEH